MNARVDQLATNQARMAAEELAAVFARQIMARVPFHRLPLSARRDLCEAARRAHPHNKAHRARWIRARRVLDLNALTPRVAIGKGQVPARTIHELARWERAARMVC